MAWWFQELGVHSQKFGCMALGKRKAFERLRDEFKAKFGRELNEDIYRHTFRGYADAIKVNMELGKIVRLTYLGSFQPSKGRLKVNVVKKDSNKLGLLPKMDYICSSERKYIGSQFKPIEYDPLTTRQKKDP